jgi:hypothetical protein
VETHDLIPDQTLFSAIIGTTEDSLGQEHSEGCELKNISVKSVWS